MSECTQTQMKIDSMEDQGFLIEGAQTLLSIISE